MNQKMKNRYRVFRRGWGTYYCEDLLTKKQETLRTCARDEASRLVAAKNESEAHHAFSRRLARVYWNAGATRDADVKLFLTDGGQGSGGGDHQHFIHRLALGGV